MRFTWRYSDAPRLWDLDVNFLAFDGEWIDFNAGTGNLNRPSGRGIELPAMPRTDELPVVDDAGSKRTSAMRTDVTDGRKPPANAGNTILFTAAPEFLRGAFRGHFAD